MQTVDELIKEKGIRMSLDSAWKASPTVRSYTDFSKLDLTGISLQREARLIEPQVIHESSYMEFFPQEHDPLLEINRTFQNLRGLVEVSGDKTLRFAKNDTVIANIRIKLEKKSRLRIDLGEYKLFCMTLDVDCAGYSDSVLEVESRGSGITYLRVRKRLGEGSKLVFMNRHIKDKFLFLDADGVLGERSSLDSKIYVYADSGAHYDCVQNADHTGFDSRSNVIGRGVVDGPSSLIFRGMLKIHKEKCSGNFATKTINMSSGDAFTDSVPMLDIKANNVIARHSSAIENIDKSELFYLASRGFEQKEASKLIIDSMLGVDE